MDALDWTTLPGTLPTTGADSLFLAQPADSLAHAGLSASTSWPWVGLAVGLGILLSWLLFSQRSR